jgi:MORN repeat
MLLEFEHSVSVKDHVEKLVKSKNKDKELKRADLIESLVLLKQLKHYNLHRPEFSSRGCIPAWYQQISGDSANSSGVAELLTVVDNDSNEDDIIDIDNLDESAVIVARTLVKAESGVEQHENTLNDDESHASNDRNDAGSSVSSIINKDREQTAWTGRDDETYTGGLVNGVFHGSGVYTCATFKYTGEYNEGQKQG